MDNFADSTADFSAPTMVEGIAQVVEIDGRTAWLVPEQGSSCGSCASASACGSKGIGTTASRLDNRRFRIDNDANLAVGERVVFGIRENVLLKASITAYAIPLATLLLAGSLAQWKFGSDIVTMAAMIAGLVAGLGLSRLEAGRLHSKGDLAPLFLRRARPGETCNS
ncbi:MAG: Fis family transcriptional regulator [Betaproteobacteria bacterium RBG_16_56_24]|nr:MAG: Fis family transcriptional regulator [Betaproteobacteria bacterium RBG_16_56_24]